MKRSWSKVSQRKAVAVGVISLLVATLVVVILVMFLPIELTSSENSGAGSINSNEDDIRTGQKTYAPSSDSSIFIHPTSEPSLAPPSASSFQPEPDPATTTPSLPDPYLTASPTTPYLTASPTTPVAEESTLTTFYAIADAPYSEEEKEELPEQVSSIPSDAKFLIHLGDIKDKYTDCSIEYFEYFKNLMLLSPVPVFLVIGDNEYNDCNNDSQALEDWRSTFSGLENKWNHQFNVTRLEGRNETFSFVHKRTLFIGLNLPGGKFFPDDWSELLAEQLNWTIGLVEEHTQAVYPDADGVVLFGHSKVTVYQAGYFSGLSRYIGYDMNRSVPLLYMCGDKHQWGHETSFLNRDNALKIRLTGGTDEPPLKMMVNPSENPDDIEEAFQYERFWM